MLRPIDNWKRSNESHILNIFFTHNEAKFKFTTKMQHTKKLKHQSQKD